MYWFLGVVLHDLLLYEYVNMDFLFGKLAMKVSEHGLIKGFRRSRLSKNVLRSTDDSLIQGKHRRAGGMRGQRKIFEFSQTV